MNRAMEWGQTLMLMLMMLARPEQEVKTQEADAEKAARPTGEQKGFRENQVAVDDRSGHCH